MTTISSNLMSAAQRAASQLEASLPSRSSHVFFDVVDTVNNLLSPPDFPILGEMGCLSEEDKLKTRESFLRELRRVLTKRNLCVHQFGANAYMVFYYPGDKHPGSAPVVRF